MPGRNLAGKPMLEPFLSLFCWLGVILSIHQFSKSRSSRLFITWLAIMLLPSALSDQAPAANRMLAAAPAAAALVARGFIWIWQKVWGWCRTRQSGASAIGIVWSCLLVTGLVLSQVKSTYDYFFQWATDPRLFDGLSMGPRLAAEQALELVKTDRVYFTPASDAYNRMINDLLLDGSPVREVEGAVCLPLVDRSSQAADYVVVTVADHDSLATLHEIYPAGEEIDAILHPDGYAYAVVFHVPAGQPGPAMQSRVAVGFVDGPTLVGYSIATQQKLRPGDSFELTLYWKGNPSHVTEAVSFVHVGKGQQSDPMVANHDARMCGGAYAALEWSADEVLVDRHTLAIASDAQGGVYDVAVGVYGSVDQRRFRVVSSDVPELDDRVFITQLQVEGP